MITAPRDDFDPYRPRPDAELREEYARLRAKAPVVHLTVDGRDVYALTRYADVAAALRDTASFSSRGGLSLHPRDTFTGGRLITTDDAEHRALRRVPMPHVSRKALAAIEPEVRRYVREVVAAAVVRGEFDVVRTLAEPIPVRVVCDLLGLPDDDREKFVAWARASTAAQGPRAAVGALEVARMNELLQYFVGLATDRRYRPDGLAARIFAATEGANATITVGDAASIVYGGFVIAGLHTSVAGLSRAVALLAGLPEQWRRWRKLHSSDDLARVTFGAELVRHQMLFPHLYRAATADVEVAGHGIPASRTTQGVDPADDDGPRVLLLVGAANHDPAQFENPGTFDPERPNLPTHVGFGGAGPHACLGQHLFDLELTALLDAFAEHGIDEVTATETTHEQNASVRALTSLKIKLTTK